MGVASIPVLVNIIRLADEKVTVRYNLAPNPTNGGVLMFIMDRARRFRELLSESNLIQAPGAYDCLSARLIEAAGFPVVYMTGFGTSAAYLGKPDVGFLGMSEMVDN